MRESWLAYFYRTSIFADESAGSALITSALPVRTGHGPVLLVDLDAAFGGRRGREIVAVPSATGAIDDGQAEGGHIARLERLFISVQRKLAGSGPDDASRAL